jgi:peroxiredoxin Q/BCP
MPPARRGGGTQAVFHNKENIMSKLGKAFAVGFCTLAAAVLVGADAPKAGLQKGDKAPEFTAMDDQGKEWKSSDHVGKKVVVVYFFPADCTGGCSVQARTFRDDMKKLKAKGIEVVGVSGDSVDNHKVFKKLEKLNFTLLADEDGALAKTFGVPLRKGGVFKTKDAEGNAVELKRGVTAARWTFVIGKDGTIIYKETKVNPARDSKNVLALVEKDEK